MRRSLLGLAAAALALTAVPAFAEDDVELYGACEAPASAVVVTAAKDASGTVATPLLPGDVSRYTVLLSLEGEEVGSTASASALVSWGISANDYDITTSGGGSSAKFNAGEMPATEEAFAGGFEHCSPFTVNVENFAAPVVVDTITATVELDVEEPSEFEFEF